MTPPKSNLGNTYSRPLQRPKHAFPATSQHAPHFMRVLFTYFYRCCVCCTMSVQDFHSSLMRYSLGKMLKPKLHPKPHEGSRQPLRHILRLLPRHFDHAEQFLNTDLQLRVEVAFPGSEASVLQHAQSTLPLRIGGEQFDLLQDVLQGQQVRDGRDANFGVEGIVEAEVSENWPQRGGRDDKQAATL